MELTRTRENSDSGMPVLEKTPLQFDAKRLLLEAEALILKWGVLDQSLCLNHPPHVQGTREKFYFGCGSLRQKVEGRVKYRALEKSFTELHSDLAGSELERFYHTLLNYAGGPLGRFRIMVMDFKTCYSFHRDPDSPRYHFVLQTNPESFLLVEAQPGLFKPMHIPCDGYVYRFDSSRLHSAVNAGETARLHLVVSHSEYWFPISESALIDGPV